MQLAIKQDVRQDKPDRLRFLTLHLYDLQTLRWLGLHLALILSPAFFFLSIRQNCWLLSLMVVFTVGWFIAFTRTMRKRFGYTKLTLAQRAKIRSPSRWLALIPATFLLGHLYCRYELKIRHDDLTIVWGMALWLLIRVVDKTNPLARRVMYGVGLAVLTIFYLEFALWRPTDDWRGTLAFSAVGVVLLVLALFDYFLLCRAAQGTALQESWVA